MLDFSFSEKGVHNNENKKLIMILLIVAATVSYADERTDTIKQIDKIIDNAITKAIEDDKTNPYLKENRIKAIKEQILAAIKKI